MASWPRLEGRSTSPWRGVRPPLGRGPLPPCGAARGRRNPDPRRAPLHVGGAHAARPRLTTRRAGPAVGRGGGPGPVAGHGERPPRRPGAPSRPARRGAAAAGGRGSRRRRCGDAVRGRAPAARPDPRGRLPAPRANVMVGSWSVDLHWPAQALVVEVDGFAFHGGRAAFERDRRRTPSCRPPACALRASPGDRSPASRSSSRRCWRACSRSSDEKRPARGGQPRSRRGAPPRYEFPTARGG